MGLLDRFREKNTHEKKMENVDLLMKSFKEFWARTYKKPFPGNRIMDLACELQKAALNSRWREVIKYGEELAQIFRNADDKGGCFPVFRQLFEPLCYQYLAKAYRELGEFDKAMKFHEKSLEIAEK